MKQQGGPLISDHDTLISPSDARITPNVSVLWKRFFAAILDVIFISVLGWIINTTFGVTRVTGGMLPQPGQTTWTTYSTATIVDWWWTALLAFGYFFVLETLFSTTLGKAMLLLRVIPSSDDRKGWHITLWQALLRNIVRPLEVTQLPYLFGVGFIAIVCLLITKKHQRVGDLLAHTIVVDSKTLPAPAYRSSQIHLRMAMILAVLVCFLAFCSVFYYDARPPLVIEGLQNTHQLLNGTVQTYTLGNPLWGSDNHITYPIHVTVLNAGKSQTCDGHLTLHWSGFLQGWVIANADWQCTP